MSQNGHNAQHDEPFRDLPDTFWESALSSSQLSCFSLLVRHVCCAPPFIFSIKLGEPGAPAVTKWALAHKLHFSANVASRYLLIQTTTGLGYYEKVYKVEQNLLAQLPETLPGPSGYLPGCSVSHLVEDLPVFLPGMHFC